MSSQLRTIKSFVLRCGRMTERQKLGYYEYLIQYAIPFNHNQFSMQELFNNTNPVILEIGFGMGDSLLQDAKDSPDINIIGAEVHKPGVGHLSYQLHQDNINNVKIFPDDANILLDSILPNNSLEGIRIFFPDPWPKKRHHKRRLISGQFIKKLLPLLKNNSWVHCATDWEDYALAITDLLENTPGLINQASIEDLNTNTLQRNITKFEARGKKLGYKIHDLVYKKVIDNPI